MSQLLNMPDTAMFFPYHPQSRSASVCRDRGTVRRPPLRGILARSCRDLSHGQPSLRSRPVSFTLFHGFLSSGKQNMESLICRYLLRSQGIGRRDHLRSSARKGAQAKRRCGPRSALHRGWSKSRLPLVLAFLAPFLLIAHHHSP